MTTAIYIYGVENATRMDRTFAEKIAGEITLSDVPGQTIKKWRDIFEISQQTRRLIRAATTILLFIGMWATWNDVLPAFEKLGEHELYHLAEDPYETRNLASQAEMQPKLVGLAERIRRWQARTGDTTETDITEAV